MTRQLPEAAGRKSRPLRTWRVLSCAALLVFASLAYAAADLDETREALGEIVEQLNDLDTWFGDADKKRVRWLQEVQEKDQEVARVRRRVDEAERSVSEIRQELSELEREQDLLQARRAEQARHIADHLATAYRMSGEDFVKLLLNQESPETFDRMMRYHRYFSDARVAALVDYQNTLDALEENQALLEARAEEEQMRQQTLSDGQAALESERDERKKLLARLDAEAEDKTVERERLKADRHRLEKLLAELQRRAQTLDGKAFAARKGALVWPINGRVLNGFGQSRAEGRLAWHGIMVGAEEGTEIRAVFRGRVVFADWLRGFGLLTIVDHGSGYMTLYGHAELVTKNVGDWVESGDTIARAGRSGGQSRSGLYFEVRQNGEARDPISWLSQR